MTTTQVLSASASDKDTIATLMTPYLLELEQPAEYPYLAHYWQETEHRFPYLIKTSGSVAGFVLVRKTQCFEIAEFYIIPEQRRKAIGREAVAQALKRHPGNWLVSIDSNNLTGQAFWMKTLSHYLKGSPDAIPIDNRLTLTFSH
ncbi:GNAT family N-acetyltransferase [Granulosicoccus antarcticus]|uniref:N-acetyltransferase domain-containing protein n=1 Tax=Granulosicoccus antarcticus IMCC3135 TaxID=1192854 RepID=A0A2Z2NHP0_9GAMM|nr:GNAT family N-acetyltransferase [Granulosicoccus antarcticus]ASJ70659.1 hypothetical protein IMCC3135_02730 [Granulosicoccus antarcticus IMCC3135]